MKRSELKRTPFKPTVKPAKGPRQKKCANRECRALYVPDPAQSFRTWCSPECGTVIALTRLAKQKAAKAKAERAETKQKREGLKNRSDYLREAQTALNRWIREVRDADEPCISCKRHHDGQYHAGHYLARGSHPHLALVEMNLAKQCAPCNVHLSGNQIQMRIGMVERYGVEAVEALEADMTPRKYTIDDLKAIKATYVAKLKGLKNGNGGGV